MYLGRLKIYTERRYVVEWNPGEGGRAAIKNMSTWMQEPWEGSGMLVSEKNSDSLDGQSGKR